VVIAQQAGSEEASFETRNGGGGGPVRDEEGADHTDKRKQDEEGKNDLLPNTRPPTPARSQGN
jgi:hypothetical protein